MKNMKKIVALVLAMLMVAGMMSAMAASIEVKDDADSVHEYKVYQIFTGTLDNEGKLSDIKYGSNYTGNSSYADAVAEAKAVATTNDARAFATALQDEDNTNGEISGEPVATLNKDNGFKKTGLADGYYLIVDTTANLPKGDMLSRYIVQVSGTTEIAPKKSTVEEDKKITADEHDADPNTNGTGEDISEDQKADDVSIGEKVTYTIDAKIPLSAADYDKFYFIINDTLSDGLTFLPDTVSVYSNEIKDTKKLTGDDYTLLKATDTSKLTTGNHTFEVAIKNAKNRAGETIYVVYQAQLNEHALIGELANTNKTTVTYSNNPEHKYNGEPDDNNDGKPDEYTPGVYGESPERETRTFTSSIQILKVDEKNQPLKGAEFEITGTSVKTVLVTTDQYTMDDTIVEDHYYKLNDGTYTKTAPTTGVSYEKLPMSGKPYDGGYVLKGSEYVVATYDQLKDSTTEIYRKVNATAGQYADTTHTYTKSSVTTPVTTSETVKAKAFVDENGLVKFVGLGSGTYTITETTIPAGYNGIPAFTVTIGFDKEDADQITDNNNNRDDNELVWFAHSDFVKTSENSEGTIAEIDTNNDGTMDTFKITVKNVSGSTLPSTGGMGTTILYIGGSILVILAAVLLITKRRMNAED